MVQHDATLQHNAKICYKVIFFCKPIITKADPLRSYQRDLALGCHSLPVNTVVTDNTAVKDGSENICA